MSDGRSSCEVTQAGQLPFETPASMLAGCLGLVLMTCAWSGCSVLPKIDVCERSTGDVVTVNMRPEGNQVSNGNHAVAAMPLSGAFAVFMSDVSGAKDEMDTEIRGTLIDDNGRRVDTCGNSEEPTYASPADGDGTVQRLYAASVAPPVSSDDGELGVIVFAKLTAESYADTSQLPVNGNWQIYGTTICNTGCSCGEVPTFRISDERPGFVVAPPTAVALGKSRFAVFWTVLESPHYLLRGRIFDLSLLGPRYLATIDPLTGLSSEGAAVSLRPYGEQPVTVEAVTLDDMRIAIAWASNPMFNGGLRVQYAIINDRFEFELGPIAVDLGLNASSAPKDVRVALAYDGRQLMLAWPQRDDTETSRVFGVFFDEEGRLLPNLDTNSTAPFRLGTHIASEESAVTLVARNDGGFAVAWQEEQVSTGGGGVTSIRLGVFGPDRSRAFLNEACDQSDFRLNRSVAGDQCWVSLTQTRSGNYYALWTDYGPTEINQRGASELRSMGFGPHDLLPLK